MCLLAVIFRAHPDAPLVVAANRDELYARPAEPMTVLAPGILGGRDLVAGGTWLAVSARGLVAGLTNLPGGRDAARRSRGELPLWLARHDDARTAALGFVRAFRPADYNPAWLLVGDRRSLFYLELTGGDAPRATELAPGLHVLENRPLGAPSPKVDQVRAALAGLEACRGEALLERLRAMLADHRLPPGAGADGRPAATEAACVHAGEYGTRSATLVVVPDGAPPRVQFTDGPACTARFREAAWPPEK
jgi:uncharacterized protein with NRDE domain